MVRLGFSRRRLENLPVKVKGGCVVFFRGGSYYNTGTVFVTSDTKITRNGVNCTADALKLGDYASVKVSYSTHTAIKVEATGP
jgi:hypothetical protein